MKKILSVLLVLTMVFALAACGEKKPEVKTASFQIGQVVTAAHGTKCFTVATAVIEGDKIVKAFIDEYQYMKGEGVVAVPNGDNPDGLGGSFTTESVLGSKRDSDAYYTASLQSKAGATMDYVDNLNTIQAYCEGKTIAEIENGADAVSGCTLTDASNYVKAVADAAKAAKANKAYTYEYTGDAYNVSFKMINTAAHGTKCFTIAAALTDGETIIVSYLDEFQYMTEGAEGVVPVPNSDNFKSYIKEGSVLGSKRYSDVYYTNNLKNKAGATMDYVDNLNTIQDFVNGKKIAELGSVDAVSGCTLTDASNYVKAIVDAAK